MKRTILLFGSHGAKVGQALVWAACAGTLDVDLDLLLIGLPPKADDPLTGLIGDYEHIRTLCSGVPGQGRAFRSSITLRCWPDKLPDQCITLRQWAIDPQDALLCGTLFPHKVADASAIRGYDGAADAASVVFSGLLDDPANPLNNLAAEEGRTVLCGSVADAVSSAGLHAAATRLTALGCADHTAALLLLPYTEEDNTAVASAALGSFASCGLKTIYTLGLSEGDAASCKMDKPHLVEWQAVHCLLSYLHADAPAPGLYASRMSGSRLGWESFGPLAEQYRQDWGALIKTAAMFTLHFAPSLRRAITAPNWLRDRKLGWYSTYFSQVKRMDDSGKQAILRDMSILMRLMDGARTWMEELLQNLPPILRSASVVEQARQIAQENYTQLLELTGQTTMLQRSAEASGLSEKTVHRHDMEDTEAEELQSALQKLQEKCQQLAVRQETLDKQIGGSARLRMLKNVRRRVQQESARLHEQAEEAQRRIDHAAQIASPEEQHRVATARTKLQRMLRYIDQLDMQLQTVRQDEQLAAKARRLPPEIAESSALPENDLFDAELLMRWHEIPTNDDNSRLFKQLNGELMDAWVDLLLPHGGPTSQQLLDSLNTCDAPDASPLAALLQASLHHSMKEVRP